MGVRLTAVTLQGFQAYGERVEVDVDPHLTVIAGRNNVGKSALLRALRLGVEPAEGLQPDFSLGLTWTGQPAVMSKYPRFRDAFRGLAAVYTTVRPGTAGPNVGLSSIVVDVGGEVSPTLPADVQTLPESWAKYLDPGDAPQVETALKTFATEQLGTVKAMRARPSDHTPTPTGPQRNLNPSADNLANVFLWINNNEFETHRRLCTALSRAFPEVVRVEAPLTTAHVEVVVRMRHVADPVPLRDCGTGIQQYLALLIDIERGSPDTLHLIDEPQAFLHPHAERALLDVVAEREDRQFMIATHSPTILRAVDHGQVRVVERRDDGRTRIWQAESAADVLDGTGLTPADLWLADAVLWVEGESDRLAVNVIVSALRQLRGIKVAEVPTPDMFKKHTAYSLAAAVSSVITDMPIPMLFMFDRDEKSDAEVAKLQEACKGQARVLSVRELENLFLQAEAIQEVLTCLATVQGTEQPSQQAVSDALDELRADNKNSNLYPPKGSLTGAAAIKGSEVLRMLFARFLTSVPYDKKRHGLILMQAAYARRPSDFDEITGFLDELRREARGDQAGSEAPGCA